jgi:hypothetical protein
MSKVVAIMSMSLDGYVVDLNDGVAECSTSKVRRPVSTAPSSDQRPRRCSALGPDT